jgi:hypothetical protein
MLMALVADLFILRPTIAFLLRLTRQGPYVAEPIAASDGDVHVVR